jgi:hypothetical protein
MVLAAFTAADAALMLVEFAFSLLWVWIAAAVIFDVFASHDLSNLGKALWVLGIFMFPLVGVLAYMIVRGHTMHEHQPQDRRPFDFRLFTRTAAPAPRLADHVGKLADLRDHGVLTDEEFERAKARVASDLKGAAGVPDARDSARPA